MKVEFKKAPTLNLPTHCLSLTRDEGDHLYAACLDGGIYAVAHAGKEPPQELARHNSYASGVNWSPLTKHLVSAGYDGKLRWINPSEKKITREVNAHQFWSWQSAVSRDGSRVASSTGQYVCGGYKYEPAKETEPSVKVFDAKTGEQTHAFEHVPPVESVAFSNDGTHLAAGNLMGEVRIWELATSKEVARISTPNFTGWGIIKGHYYTGGIYSLAFSPDDSEIFLAGMGTTRDPAAGNGKQLWERWSWREGEPKNKGSAHDGEIGQGLMESLAIHPEGRIFAMAGRLFKGDWNVAIFDRETGSRLAHTNCNMRVSKALWSEDGSHLYLAGGKSQPSNRKDIENPDWGRIKVFKIVIS